MIWSDKQTNKKHTPRHTNRGYNLYGEMSYGEMLYG